VRFITDADVARHVSPGDALEAVRGAFSELAAGTAAIQARHRTAVGDVKLSTLGAVLGGAGVLGAKAYSTVGGRFTFLVVLFAADDGRRLAVLESDELTRLRTAATSVLSTELLGRPAPRHLVVFGAGSQATAHIDAFAARFALDRITMVTREARRELALELSGRVGTEVRSLVAGRAQHALTDADVVITATRSTTPVFEATRLAPGTHVCAVGSSRPDARELAEQVYDRARPIAVEWRDQARGEAGGLLDAVGAGLVAWDDVVELAEVAAGRAGGRSADDDVSVFQSVGIGLEDVAVAAIAWRATRS
jgi:ornithine cyclodeaminase